MTIWFFSIIAIICAGIAVYLWYIWSSDLPHIGLIKEYRPPIITEVFSDEGEVIGRFWDEKRIIVPLDQLPLHLIHAFVAAEDARFFEHEGVDIKSIIRAFYKNLSAAKIEQGASTITQQVTRSLLLKNTKRTYRRKVREIILSFLLEKRFSKDEILFFYLNKIYLGQGAYGVEAAARTFFNKSAKDLNIAESALLAGLPQAPSRYSPTAHLDRAKARQEYVLERMHAEDFLTDQELKHALEAALEIQTEKENVFEKAPYFTEHIRRYLQDKYGWDQLYRGGLKVYTTLNLGMQYAAKNAMKKGLSDCDKREGYRGPVKHLTIDEIPDFDTEAITKFSLIPPEIDSLIEGLVEWVDDESKEVVVRIGDEMGLLPFSEMKWARAPDPDVPYYLSSVKKPSDVLKAGDVILVRLLNEGNAPFAWDLALEQTPDIEGALFCMAAETGEVKAMTGGRDFGVSQFNRAIQSRRQPGSAFKPLIYSAALDWGMGPATILMDAPYISDQNPDEEVWKPKNYKEKFFGPTLLRTALSKSRNVITVKILKKIKVGYAIQYAKNMGIESNMSPDLSLALGSSGVSLEEITNAYSVFTNTGMLVKSVFIKRIEDRNGQIIEENQPEVRRAISKETAFIMTDLLRAVIQDGTGWRIKALKRPAAGKTGTTNNLRDAWFVGYTPELVTGVWVGYDDRKAMGKGETGSRTASPIWLDFMSNVLKDLPVVDFKVPDGLVFAKIDTKTGLLASPHSDETVFQAFKDGTEPKEYSPRPEAPKSGQFMQYDTDEAR
ncbi:MAG: PBP1A family penicillin-binding protein [Desulfobacterales bacterium]|nr:PBP1A family penicillin-binding protein [Desulfobacterales bacterium]